MNSLSGGAGSISTQISNAIAQLDSNSTTNTLTGTPSVSYTLSAFEQRDGVVEATFSPIQIGESQVTSAAGGWITDGLAAKAPSANPTFTGTVTLPAITSSSADTAAATKKYVDDKTAGLTGAMHFKGAVTPLPDATAATTFNTYESGDVVLGPNDKEYVYKKGNDAASSSWIELGDESSYAIKGSITDNDFADGATLPQSRIANLSTDLDNKAPKNNPTFTGTVTLPDTTPTADTQAATKKYVDDTVNTAKNNLHQIATSGSIYDIEEGSNTTQSNHPDTSTKDRYLILDCGTAEILID